MFRRILRRYQSFSDRAPVLCSTCTGAVVVSTGDLLTQKFVEKRETVDKRRVAAFAGWGFLWCGIVQRQIYTVWIERLVTGTGLKAATGKMALDQFAHVPFAYMPGFYYWMTVSRTGTTVGAWEALSAKYFESLVACWSMWVPAMVGIFAVVPVNCRVLAVVGVGVVWNSLLSLISNSKDAKASKA